MDSINAIDDYKFRIQIDATVYDNMVVESIDTQYWQEEQLRKLINMFTVIACLGLFGLFSFTSVQRQKEIGVRKFNGLKYSKF